MNKTINVEGSWYTIACFEDFRDLVSEDLWAALSTCVDSKLNEAHDAGYKEGYDVGYDEAINERGGSF